MTYKSAFVFIIPSLLIVAVCAAGQMSRHRTVWNGVYTEAQAARGETIYKENCSRCHGEDLKTNTQAVLNGSDFMQRWREDNVESLFIFIRTNMPPTRRGTQRVPLADDLYLDVLTYILKSNSFPAGELELSTRGLAAIQIEDKDGPKPLPNSSLVLVVGCMTRLNEDTWVLTSSTEPVRTRIADVSTMDELKEDQAKLPGMLTFKLQNILYLGTAFKPESYEGHRMQAKGILIRQPNAERIDVRSLAEVSSTCGK